MAPAHRLGCCAYALVVLAAYPTLPPTEGLAVQTLVALAAQSLASRLARGRSYFAAKDEPERRELPYLIRSAEAAVIAIGESAAPGVNPTKASPAVIMAEVARDSPPSLLAASWPKPVSMVRRMRFAFSNMHNQMSRRNSCLRIAHDAFVEWIGA